MTKKLNAKAQEMHTYDVLIKENIFGMPVDKVMFTLCDNAKKGGTKGVPSNCKFSNQDTFTAPEYKAVKALQKNRLLTPRRKELGLAVSNDLFCVLGHLMHHCLTTGIATADLKAANFVYGKKMGQGANKLFLVDAMYMGEDAIPKASRADKCPFFVVEQFSGPGMWECTKCPHWKGLPAYKSAKDIEGWGADSGYCPDDE